MGCAEIEQSGGSVLAVREVDRGHDEGLPTTYKDFNFDF